MHRGHQHILNQLKSEAENIGGETVIITFHPHPRKIVGQTHTVQLLNTLDEKIELLGNEGIDHLLVIPFDEAFAEQSAEAYIQDFLVKKIHPHTIIIGYDHRFGKNRTGNYLMLEQYAPQLGFVVKEISKKVLNEVAVSSTQIRKALQKGDINQANDLLGYSYFFEGKIVKGKQLGQTIGYPTANLSIENEEKLIPANGVYAVEISLNGVRRDGMMNIGFRPTVGGKRLTIEVNIFDFNQDVYGAAMRVYLKCYLRSEQKFNGLNELTDQLARDKTEAIKCLH